MLKTKDEILIKFADILNKDFPIPSPKPPKTEELEIIPPTSALESEDKLPRPIEIKQPIEPESGTAEWVAKYHPREFLMETQRPYRGWIQNPANAGLVKKVMDDIVAKHPENYFAWKLNRRIELIDWLYPAAKELIKKDPIAALMAEIYRFPGLKDLYTELWKTVLDREISSSLYRSVGHDSNDPRSGEFLGKEIFRKMRHLAGMIAREDPDFYLTFIEGKPVTTPGFDEEARRVIKQKEDLGKFKPISLRHKTKL